MFVIFLNWMFILSKCCHLSPSKHIMNCHKLNLDLYLWKHVQDKLYFILSSLEVVYSTSAFLFVFFLSHSSQLLEHSLFIFFNCAESSEE